MRVSVLDMQQAHASSGTLSCASCGVNYPREIRQLRMTPNPASEALL